MDKLAQQFSDLAAKYGPDVVSAAKGAAVVEGYSSIVQGVVGLVFAGGLVFLASWFYKKMCTEDWDDIVWIPICFCGIGAAIFAAFGLTNLLNPWTWTAINHPELWLAKQALHI